MKTPEYLLPALRQYQHNDCSGLLPGFDHDETIIIVERLLEDQRQMCADAIPFIPVPLGYQEIQDYILNATGESK